MTCTSTESHPFQCTCPHCLATIYTAAEPELSPEALGKEFPGWWACETPESLSVTNKDNRAICRGWQWSAPQLGHGVETRQTAYAAARDWVREQEKPKATCCYCSGPLECLNQKCPNPECRRLSEALTLATPWLKLRWWEEEAKRREHSAYGLNITMVGTPWTYAEIQALCVSVGAPTLAEAIDKAHIAGIAALRAQLKEGKK